MIKASKTIALVACVSKKQDTPQRAKDLYISDWFRKASTYAKRNADQWFILSAKHGLLSPDTLIHPYNETLNTMPAANRKWWSERVLGQISLFAKPGDRVIFLAGVKYRQYLIESLKSMGCVVEIPMAGLRIGEQLRWLGQRIGGV